MSFAKYIILLIVLVAAVRADDAIPSEVSELDDKTTATPTMPTDTTTTDSTAPTETTTDPTQATEEIDPNTGNDDKDDNDNNDNKTPLAPLADATTVTAEPKETFELQTLANLNGQVKKFKEIVSKTTFPRIPRATKEHTELLKGLTAMMEEMVTNVKTQNLFDDQMSAEQKDSVKRQHGRQQKMKKLLRKMKSLHNNVGITPEKFHSKKTKYSKKMQSLTK